MVSSSSQLLLILIHPDFDIYLLFLSAVIVLSYLGLLFSFLKANQVGLID